MNKINIKSLIPYIFMTPSIFIGAIAMIRYGVTPIVWGQNTIIWFLGTILGCVFIMVSQKKYLNNDRVNLILIIMIIVLLILSFWSSDLEGVHRWLSFGPINIYTASVFLPLLIVCLWRLAVKHHELYVLGLIIIVLVILLFHPDAGQVTALSCATAIIIWKKADHRALKFSSLALLIAISVTSWIFLDELAAVPYVENIIFLVGDMGIGWFILGIVSLLLLLVPFFFLGKATLVFLSLGVYFLITMVVTFFGNFPMPIMGYGISPIIGYIIAITTVIKMKR